MPGTQHFCLNGTMREDTVLIYFGPGPFLSILTPPQTG